MSSAGRDGMPELKPCPFCGSEARWALKIIVCVAMLLAMQATAQSKKQKHLTCPEGQHILQYCLSGDESIASGSSGCGLEQCVPDKLVCDKYQTFEPAHDENCSTNMLGCYRHVEDRCVDNIHLITERQWQAMAHAIETLDKLDEVKSKRLDLLEKRTKRLESLICENNAGILWDCKKGQKVNANGK